MRLNPRNPTVGIIYLDAWLSGMSDKQRARPDIDRDVVIPVLGCQGGCQPTKEQSQTLIDTCLSTTVRQDIGQPKSKARR